MLGPHKKSNQGSYCWKHTIENHAKKQDVGYYVSNGITILAACLLQLQMTNNAPNVRFPTLRSIPAPPVLYLSFNHITHEMTYQWKSQKMLKYVSQVASSTLLCAHVPKSIVAIVCQEYLQLPDTPSIDGYRILALQYAGELNKMPNDLFIK